MDLAKLIKNSKVLKKYLPYNLFSESNLPQVQIVMDKKSVLTFEDPSLVISHAGYLPGRPTYRHEVGVFIPLQKNSKLDKIIFTDVTRFYHGEEVQDIDPSNLLSRMPLEFELLSQMSVKPIVLTTVNVVPFEQSCKSEGGDTSQVHEDRLYLPVRWLFWRKSKNNVDINEYRNNNDLLRYPFHIYLDESMTFPRIFSYVFQTRNRNTRGFISGVFDQVEFHKGEVFIGVYAFDVLAKLRGCFTAKKDDDNKYTGCQHVDLSQCRLEITKNKNRKITEYFIKIPVELVRDQSYVLVPGYEIKDTYLIRIKFDIGKIKNIIDTKLNEYWKLSIHTALTNYIKYLLSYSLNISNVLINGGYVKTNKFVEQAMLYYDLYYDLISTNSTGKKPISVELRENSDVGKIATFLAEIFEYYDTILTDKNMPSNLKVISILTSSSERKGETLRILLKSSRKARLDKSKLSEEIENIFKKYITYIEDRFGEKVDFADSVIYEIVRHTLSHHFIKEISSSAMIRPDKLIDTYVELKDDSIELAEADSGGYGVLTKEFFDRYTYHDKLLRFVLNLGKCKIGVPEDVLHFMIVYNKDRLKELARGKRCDEVSSIRDDVTKLILETIGRLYIVVSDEELNETKALWSSIVDEACRLVEVGGYADDNLEATISLLTELHDIRHELEQKIERFPDLDEIIIFLLMNHDKIINTVLLKVLKKLYSIIIDSDHKLKSDLIGLYNIGDLEYIVDKIYEEVRFALQYSSPLTLERDSDVMSKALYLLGKALRGVLMRLSLTRCNGACGLCYVNTKSCTRHTAPFVQALTLDRRLLKLLATTYVKEHGKSDCGANQTTIARVQIGDGVYKLCR